MPGGSVLLAGPPVVETPAPVVAPVDSGARVVLAVVGGSLAAAFVLPALAGPAVPVVALAVGVHLLGRGRTVAFWELVVWLYLVSPEIRRVVDWRSGYHANSPVLVAAPVLAMLGLLALQRGGRLRRAPAVAFYATLLAVAYATVLGLVLATPTAVLVGVLEWAGPLGLAAVLLLGGYRRSDLLTALVRTGRWGLLVLGGYGVVQFFLLPPWDVAWMQAVRDLLSSIGSPEPLKVRVFSTSNSPGPLAATVAVLLPLSLCTRRGLLDDLAVCLGVTVLGLSLVRASWIVFGVTLVLLVLSGRLRLARVVGAALAVTLVLGVVGGPLTDAIVGRFDQSTSAGSEDESLQARLRFQSQVLPQVLAAPVGQGLGSTGVAAQRSSGGDAIVNVDSGYVEVLLVFGAPLGVLALVGLLAGTTSAWRRSLRVRGPDGPLEVALASTVVVLPVSLLFNPSITAGAGVLFWTALAVCAGPDRQVVRTPGTRRAA